MDHESLRTASTYLNNLLLARGLLRNGEAVDFVKPSKESRAQIINLVHDLILREDRDKDQREHVANTLRQLRSEDARKSQEIERLQAKSEESARAAVQAQQAERNANGEVKKVEKVMKTLQDQATKLKTTLAQVKTQCANDVKKRDLELARLKTHLQGQQRGSRVGMVAPSMTVRRQTAEPQQDVHDPAYSLKQETTEFLTQLSQSLSDENDGLISLIRTALDTMHDLLGTQATHPDSAIGSVGSNQDKHKSATSLVRAPPTSYEVLAADLESTLNQLKSILTNPNFVSLEEFEREIETRDDEIESLREGWEHMEQRWREVLGMMQGWLKRMNTGDTINIEDLRKGMGLVTPRRRERKARTTAVEKEDVHPNQDSSLVDSDSAGDVSSDMVDLDNARATSVSSPRGNSSLSASDGMRSLTDKLDRLDSPKRKRDALEPPDMFDFRPSAASKNQRTSAQPISLPKARSSRAHTPEPALATTVAEDDESEDLEIPQMTIAEKLSAAQEEADQAAAARVAGGNSATGHRPRRDAAGLDDERDDDTLGKMPGEDTLGEIASGSPMAKRTRIKGRPKKRRGTLSRDEMASLIEGF